MKYLILFLITFTASANYVKQAELSTDSISKVWVKQSDCGQGCISIPFGYNKNFHKMIDEEIDDVTSPINSKNDIEACADQAACETALALKVCTDSNETAYIDALFTELYCSKVTGYNQKLSGRKIVVEDAALKTSFESQKTQDQAKEAAIQMAQKAMKCGQRVIAAMLIRNQPKGLTKPQVRNLVKTYSDIKDLLETGSLDSAREDIAAVVVNAPIVTQADKDALVAELDACK